MKKLLFTVALATAAFISASAQASVKKANIAPSPNTTATQQISPEPVQASPMVNSTIEATPVTKGQLTGEPVPVKVQLKTTAPTPVAQPVPVTKQATPAPK